MGLAPWARPASTTVTTVTNTADTTATTATNIAVTKAPTVADAVASDNSSTDLKIRGVTRSNSRDDDSIDCSSNSSDSERESREVPPGWYFPSRADANTQLKLQPIEGLGLPPSRRFMQGSVMFSYACCAYCMRVQVFSWVYFLSLL